MKSLFKTSKFTKILIALSIIVGYASTFLTMPFVPAESPLQIPIEIVIWTSGQQLIYIIVSLIIATPIFFIARRKKYLLDYFSYVFLAVNILMLIGALAYAGMA